MSFAVLAFSSSFLCSFFSFSFSVVFNFLVLVFIIFLFSFSFSLMKIKLVITCAKLGLKSSGVAILQGVEFSVFLSIVACALQQCSTTALPVIYPMSCSCAVWCVRICCRQPTFYSCLKYKTHVVSF